MRPTETLLPQLSPTLTIHYPTLRETLFLSLPHPQLPASNTYQSIHLATTPPRLCSHIHTIHHNQPPPFYPYFYNLSIYYHFLIITKAAHYSPATCHPPPTTRRFRCRWSTTCLGWYQSARADRSNLADHVRVEVLSKSVSVFLLSVSSSVCREIVQDCSPC